MIYENFIDSIVLLFIFCVLSAIIVIVWLSTFVSTQDPLIPTATMVVLPEQPSTNTIAVAATTSESFQDSVASQQTGTENNLRKRNFADNSAENIPSTEDSQTVDQSSSELSLADSVFSQPSDNVASPNLSKLVQNDSEEQSLGMQHTQEYSVNNPNLIKIRLKYLDDTQKQVYGDLQEDVGSFKRKNFDVQMTPTSVVKLIFNGRMLSEDRSTLEHYGLFDNCVVHCFISQRSETQQPPTVSESYNIDLSEFFAFIVGGVLAFLWYLFIYHNQIFNFPSTISLLFITGMVLVTYNPLSLFEYIVDDIYVNYIIDIFQPVFGRQTPVRQEEPIERSEPVE